uniref:trypsin n=1 Tax=Oncorhynchus kisutch TaxID=8019 RepID=A0A8C7IKJ1_ONCKI
MPDYNKIISPINSPSPCPFTSSPTRFYPTFYSSSFSLPPVELSGNRTLQELELSIVKKSTCKKDFPGLTDNMLCAGSMKEGKYSCQGDSGGPLICRSSGVLVQVGIVSFGHINGCALKDFPVVYTRVIPYMDFIRETITSD